METILYSSDTAGLPDIVSDPDVVFGEPCIAGTNITVKLLTDRLAAGYSEQRLYDDYPRMPAGSIAVAREYTAEVEAGRLPAVWAPIMGEPRPWQHHVYAGWTEEEIDEFTEAIRDARKPLATPGLL
jgi:uncharacterized protein (DUF433 family)